MSDEHESTSAGAGELTILVVEDEAPVRDLIRRVLEQAGHTVETAANPTAALAVLREQAGELDLVVSDVIMPDMTGFDLWEESRSLRDDLRFLFVSGYVDEELEAATADPRASFLTKPFVPQELLDAVAALDLGGD